MEGVACTECVKVLRWENLKGSVDTPWRPKLRLQAEVQLAWKALSQFSLGAGQAGDLTQQKMEGGHWSGAQCQCCVYNTGDGQVQGGVLQ